MDDNILLSMLKEIRDDQKIIREDQIKHGVFIEQNTKDLTEHKEGVQQCRKRLDKLERPFVIKFWETIRSNITIIVPLLSLLGGILAKIKGLF